MLEVARNSGAKRYAADVSVVSRTIRTSLEFDLIREYQDDVLGVSNEKQRGSANQRRSLQSEWRAWLLGSHRGYVFAGEAERR